MMLFIESISYLSVLGAAVVGMIVGFLWMELSKISPQDVKNSDMMVSAALGFGVTLIISFGLAFIYHYFGASLENAFMALEFIMFFVAVESLGMLIWEKKPLTLYLITMGHKAVTWSAILATYSFLYNLIS
jgi:hypothetical protein